MTPTEKANVLYPALIAGLGFYCSGRVIQFARPTVEFRPGERGEKFGLNIFVRDHTDPEFMWRIKMPGNMKFVHLKTKDYAVSRALPAKPEFDYIQRLPSFTDASFDRIKHSGEIDRDVSGELDAMLRRIADDAFDPMDPSVTYHNSIFFSGARKYFSADGSFTTDESIPTVTSEPIGIPDLPSMSSIPNMTNGAWSGDW